MQKVLVKEYLVYNVKDDEEPSLIMNVEQICHKFNITKSAVSKCVHKGHLIKHKWRVEDVEEI